MSTVEDKRSAVRRAVTYLAAGYIFLGGPALIAGIWIEPLGHAEMAVAKDLFVMVLPVAAGIVAFWFASRRPQPFEGRGEESGGAEDERTVSRLPNHP